MTAWPGARARVPGSEVPAALARSSPASQYRRVVQREMLKSKIHRARVTQADLHYSGSLTVDCDLMDAADLLAGEKVDLLDIDNGARLSTYVIEGERGSGTIGVNGAAARLVHPGDLVIVVSYAVLADAECRTHRPRVVFVDDHNRALGEAAEPLVATSGADLIAHTTVGGAHDGHSANGETLDDAHVAGGSG